MVNRVKQSAQPERVELGLEVVPNSGQFRIMGFNPWTGALRVKLKEKALEGRANRELIEELGELFHAEAEIISGEKARKKKVRLTGISGRRAEEIIALRTP